MSHDCINCEIKIMTQNSNSKNKICSVEFYFVNVSKLVR